MHILILPGDGIGPEITAATVKILNAASHRFNLGLVLVEDVVGHESLRRSGTTVRPDLLEQAKAVQGIVLGPTATYDFKDEAKGEINPSKFFRKSFDLFANIRPAKTYPGLPGRVGAFDLVVVRENTEGFYADRNMELGNGEILVTADVGISLRRITRRCCERIARAGFELAMRRRRHVTLVHKANVLKLTDGLFLDECRKVAAEFPDVMVDDVLVDAMMAHVVRNPQRFDVIVTTNMFGDILSDLTAELSGSLGLGGSLNAGSDYAMAQAAHGSAPDIAGRNIANPYSLILSAALLLAWQGQREGKGEFEDAARAIEASVESAIAAHEVTADIGGQLGTREAATAVTRMLADPGREGLVTGRRRP
jgi:3-isopropylmalate dehydrogenase